MKTENEYDSSKDATEKRALEDKIIRRMSYLRNCSDAELRYIVMDYIKKEN